jgi:hypothetical protein
VLGFFALMSLVNIAEHWEKQKISAEYDAWQLKKRLALDDTQARQIIKINRDFYERLAKAYYTTYADNQTYCHEISRIITTRNTEIARTLNQQQQRLWQKMVNHRVLH